MEKGWEQAVLLFESLEHCKKGGEEKQYGPRIIQPAILVRDHLPNPVYTVPVCADIVTASAGGRIVAGHPPAYIDQNEPDLGEPEGQAPLTSYNWNEFLRTIDANYQLAKGRVYVSVYEW